MLCTQVFIPLTLWNVLFSNATIISTLLNRNLISHSLYNLIQVITTCTLKSFLPLVPAMTSDTNYSDWSKLHIRGTILSISPPSPQTPLVWGFPGHPYFWSTVYKFMSSHYSFQFKNLPHRTQSAIPTILIAKEYNQYQSKGDVHKARSERISNMKLLHSQDLLPSRHIEEQQYAEYSQPGRLTWASVLRTFIGVSLLGYIWQNHCPLSWTQPPSPHQRSGS